jgi:hypothetical protein
VYSPRLTPRGHLGHASSTLDSRSHANLWQPSRPPGQVFAHGCDDRRRIAPTSYGFSCRSILFVRFVYRLHAFG